MTEVTSETSRQAIEDLIAIVDELETLHVRPRKHRHLELMHGLTWYTCDTARSALQLIDADQSGSAAVLVRVALEHGTLLQWLVAEPENAEKYMQQKKFEALKFKDVAERAGIMLPADLRGEYESYASLKAIQDLQQIRGMFDRLDPAGALYLQYRYLSGYIHPSMKTTGRYTHIDGDGLALMSEPAPAPARAILYTLAMALAFAVAPYVDLIHNKPYKSRMNRISDAASVPLWATADGKPPKSRT
ncbi:MULTISPECIES: DUF5677 domain-containing protein [unclassified Nocardioides]|uniref:DUF5677 domain-containing protein n=1 Tax=unclassified Nocardioides TaxID=2615069 RepID=UPI00360A4B10